MSNLSICFTRSVPIPPIEWVILTGTGGAFMESISPEGFDFFTPSGYDTIYREGKKIRMHPIRRADGVGHASRDALI